MDWKNKVAVITGASEVYKSLDGVQPWGRIGLPEEIAATAAFL